MSLLETQTFTYWQTVHTLRTKPLSNKDVSDGVHTISMVARYSTTERLRHASAHALVSLKIFPIGRRGGDVA